MLGQRRPSLLSRKLLRPEFGGCGDLLGTLPALSRLVLRLIIPVAPDPSSRDDLAIRVNPLL
jgi:hypothetical protein